MANFYVDLNTGSNGDNGTTQALAWATIEYALESGGLSAGDVVWVRRTHIEYSGDPTSDIACAYSGDRDSLISVIGWPRAAIPNTTITSASWTNGSTTVDLVVGVTLSREAHCGRWITAPNGSKFLITRIIDSNTLIIDREYSGATVTLTNGLFQIESDEDYATRPTDIDGWDSDAIALPVIDFNDTAYRLNFFGDVYWAIKNLEIRDSTAILVYLGSKFFILQGCLLLTSNNAAIVTAGGGTFLYASRCIIEGNNTGAGQDGISCGENGALVLVDSAIYGLGGSGIHSAEGYLENVNIGVEVVNSVADIALFKVSQSVKGRDVKLGSTTKFSLDYYYAGRAFSAGKFENYGKVLGKHKTFSPGVVHESWDVVAGSGDPYKRTDGTDKIIQVDCSINTTVSAGVSENAYLLFEHEFETDTISKSYRYYVQCKDLSLTALELWLEVEYVDSYDDTSEYTITKEESDETCSLRSGVSDWTQYIEVTGIAPVTASKVRIRCFVAKYDADGLIYIDPEVVIL